MRSSLAQRVFYSCCLLSVYFAAGCSSGSLLPSSATLSPASTKTSIKGTVHGGQQPISGATIQLYAAGTPSTGGGYGMGSTPLITGTLPVTDSNGNFSITGDYTFPAAASHFYIVATGGSPGVGMPVNNNITLIAVLEGCTATIGLSPTLSIDLNEVTTVAAVMALQPFMAAPSADTAGAPAIGAPATAYTALQDAFATANNLADISSGKALTQAQNYATTDANALLINSLANTMAFCVNSDPADGDCSTLASDATPSGAPYVSTDTAQALWYIAQNPTNNIPAIFYLSSSYPPFAGLTTAPSTFNPTVATSGSACQLPPQLGSAGNYALLAGSTITNASTVADPTIVTGGLVGVSPGTAESGFTAGTYVATFDNPDAAAAESDMATAYTNIAGLLLPAVLPVDIGGVTFSPGLYNTASAVTLNAGSVTLDAQGDPNAVFIFQIGSTFTAGVGTQVILINGASAANVFWQVGSSATINGSAAWQGNILAYASITMGTDATLNGRAMASNGAVTLLSNQITVPPAPLP